MSYVLQTDDGKLKKNTQMNEFLEIDYIGCQITRE